MTSALVAKGSLGDSFLFNCILYNPDRKDTITVRQYISPDVERAKREEPSIQEIYSLSSNVDVEFIGEDEWKRMMASAPILIKGDPPGFRPSPIVCAKRGIGPTTPYPKFSFPSTEHNLGTRYVACCPKAGEPQQGKRDIQVKELDAIVGKHPSHKFVLVGSDNIYAKYDKPNILNLIGKTSLLEAMGIVSRAAGLVSIQGMLSYVALSQKVPSLVYTQTLGHTGAFYGRLFPQWVNYCTLYIKSHTEDPAPLHQFMEKCSP
jgi:hypothetical protein